MDLNDLPESFTNATASLAAQPSLANLATFLLSFVGFQDWLKLLLIGGVFEACRRFAYQILQAVDDLFWVTIDFEDGDDSYDWMMVWLSQNPAWSEARKLAVSTSSFGLETPADDVDNPKNGRKVRFVVAYDYVSTFWFERRYVRATRSKAEGSNYHATCSLHISILFGSHKTAQSLLSEAQKYWQKAREEQISVYASDSRNEWRLVASRPKRPLRSIILDAGVKEAVLDDALDFLGSKEWYSDRGIPFRRGYLLHGAPGSGKTSLIQSIAGELNLDVYVVSLSRHGLDDSSLQELISDLPEHCIALMEDIDAAFHHSVSRDLPDEGDEDDDSDSNSEYPAQERSAGVSLSGLLNALDGIGAQEGRLLFATTNRYEALDVALRRPGRMDVHIGFELASRYQVGKLFEQFYLPTHRTSTTQRSPSGDVGASKGEGDGDRSDSGYSSSVEAEVEKLIDVDLPTTGVPDQSITAIARRRKHHTELLPGELDVLVERFRKSVPEKAFSMATWQGYLLAHKNQPYRAAECVGKWVEEEMSKRESRRSSDKDQ